MKALSIRQPWAYLIAQGEKTVECRTWRTAHRGPLLICASARPAGLFDFGDGQIAELPGGVAVATVDMLDCVPFGPEHVEPAGFDKMPDRPCFAWILANARTIAPFPVKGRLGLFEVDYENRA